MPLAMEQSTGHALWEIGSLTGHRPSGKRTAFGVIQRLPGFHRAASLTGCDRTDHRTAHSRELWLCMLWSPTNSTESIGKNER
jgi:hypothetical protein